MSDSNSSPGTTASPGTTDEKAGNEPKDTYLPLEGLSKKQVLRWRLMLMAALVLPVYLETLDYTVVATAQPHIASAFNRLDLQSYIGTIYLLTSTVFLPVFASVADVFGRYLALQLALLFFLVGSALSTGAANMPMLLAGRGISGIGAAGILTTVRVILADSSSLNENNITSSMLVFLYAIGFSTGPAIGGALLSVSFRWIFAINLPCCVVSMLLAFLLLRNRTRGALQPRLRDARCYSDEVAIDDQPVVKIDTFLEKLLRIDWIGAFLFISGGILLLLALNWAGNRGWDRAEVIAPLVIGVILIILTLSWEYVLEHLQDVYVRRLQLVTDVKGEEAKKKSKRPLPKALMADTLIPVKVLASYNVLVTSFAALASGMVMLVIFYFVAIFMVIVSGKSAVNAGVQLIFFAPGMGLGTTIAIRIIKRTKQPKYAINLGGLIIPVALGLISMAVQNNNEGQLEGFMVMAGVGTGMTFGPLAIHARFSQPESRVAVVTALQLFARSLGGTIGLAQCSTILNAKVQHYFKNLPQSTLDSLTNSGGTEALSSLSSSSLDSVSAINQLPANLQQVVRDAFQYGVRWSFISLIPWTALAFLLALRLSKIYETPKEHVKNPRNGNNGDSIDIEGIPLHSVVNELAPSQSQDRRDSGNLGDISGDDVVGDKKLVYEIQQ